MNRLIDTHCHVNADIFKNDWKEVVERTLKEGTDMIVVGTDLESSKKAIEISKNYSGVFAAVGLHPTEVLTKDWRSQILRIAELIDNPKVVAIGEIGFDRYRMPEADIDKIMKTQEIVFDFFMSEAARTKKPIIIHTRDAMDILETKYLALKKKGIVGVQHCFPGNLDQAEELFKIGFKIGFTGLITFNGHWDKMIKELPLDKILIETDSPYLTPVPNRGKRNEPGYVKFVAEHIARLRNTSVDEIITSTTKNAKELFNLKI